MGRRSSKFDDGGREKGRGGLESIHGGSMRGKGGGLKNGVEKHL